MSDFLMIAPEGYYQIDGEVFFSVTGTDPFDAQGVFDSGAYWELFSMFELLGLIQDGFMVQDFKVFNSSGSKVIWYKLAQEV